MRQATVQSGERAEARQRDRAQLGRDAHIASQHFQGALRVAEARLVRVKEEHEGLDEGVVRGGHLFLSRVVALLKRERVAKDDVLRHFSREALGRRVVEEAPVAPVERDGDAQRAHEPQPQCVRRARREVEVGAAEAVGRHHGQTVNNREACGKRWRAGNQRV
eukprot:4932351-Pleurochrysis_carterae.AAC.6